MAKNIMIKMSDGSEKALKDLTNDDLPDVALTQKDGETNLTMKSEVIKSDPKHDTERRLFKWTTMPKIMMYDLKVPKTLEAMKETTKEADILEYAVGNWKIEQDKLHNGIEASGADPNKLLDKLVAGFVARGMSQVEAEKMVAGARASIKKSGFGK